MGLGWVVSPEERLLMTSIIMNGKKGSKVQVNVNSIRDAELVVVVVVGGTLCISQQHNRVHYNCVHYTYHITICQIFPAIKSTSHLNYTQL